MYSDDAGTFGSLFKNTYVVLTGASTFPGLRKFIAEVSKTRVLAFLHIARHGLASAGCTSLGRPTSRS